MAQVMRNIDHPGIEIRERDVSNYTPAIVGTYCLLAGYADAGEELEPIVNDSIDGFETIYGMPTNEAERYFYYAGREIIRNNGTLITAKMPYNNIISRNYKVMGLKIDSGVTPIVSGSSPLSAPVEVQMVGPFNTGAVSAAGYYSDYIGLSADDVQNMPTSAYDILEAGGSFADVAAGSDFSDISDWDALIINENKSRITGVDRTEGLFVTVVDPIDAMKVQRMIETEYESNPYVSGNIDVADILQGVQLPDGQSIPTSAYFATLTGSISYQSSTSEDIMNQFPTIEASENGDSIDKEYSHYIGIVVSKTIDDKYEEGKTNIGILEAFVGSIHPDKRQPSTGQTAYIGDLINAGSNYIKYFTNSTSTLPEDTGASVIYSRNTEGQLIGFTDDECLKRIQGARMVADLQTIHEKLSNIDDIQIDVVIDAGLSTIAQFTDDVAEGTTYEPNKDFDPDDTDITSAANLSAWRAVCAENIEFCSKVRKDCMCILDAPRQLVLQGESKYIRKTAPQNTFANTIGKKLRYITGLNSSYAALYSNWCRGLDFESGLNFWMPQTVKMGGIYCYNDQVAEIWDAPAGLNRGIINGINDISFNPNGKAADQIYRKSVNYAKSYPLDGFIAEGQKTTQVKPSAFDRVNVRRLFLRLERLVYQVARYFVYEPNNLYTRRRLMDAIDPIFKAVLAAGGMYDYKIVCDERNNTPDVVDRNELKVAILIQPVKTVEFILVDFIATRTGANFEEIIDAVV